MPKNPAPAPPPRPPRRTLGRGPGTGPRAAGTEPGEQVPDPAGPPDEAVAPAEPEPEPEPEAGSESVPGPEPEAPVDTADTADTVDVRPSEPSEPPEAGSGAEAPADAQGKFTVRLANFEGPFDLLLQLISKHKLDVTEVALSKVTDEFMAHIRAMGPDWDLDQTTEFLVVAATLLDLKAARLLPAAEVEDEADLALLEARDLLFARLLQYRAFKQIADILNDRLIAEGRRYPRTVGLEPHHADLLPEVVISIGAEGFAKLAVKAMQPKPKPQVYVDHIHAPLVSVREQAEIVVARLRELGEVSFRTLTEDAPDVLTVVARFLALLELYRERAVHLDQEEALGMLMVRWTGAEGREPLVTDEFDQEEQQGEKQPEKEAET
ncbi:segregation/condensation protein A [Streptomyces sp. NPDC097640]|uniref:segregation and condensation protein A n=1 Tax=Streptomyces sp. NPDC097640 TaxID=3157229 RepID=UPI00332A2570